MGWMVTPSYTTWVAAIERRHRLILAGSLLLCLLSATSLTRLRLDLDVLGMLPQGSPAFDDFKSFVADFGELDELIVLIQGAPPPELRQFADAFAARLMALDAVIRVHSRLDMDQLLDGLLGQYVYNYFPEAEYAALERRLTPAAIDAQVIVNRAILNAPFDLSATTTVVEDPLGLRLVVARALAKAYGRASSSTHDGYFATPDGSALLLFVRPTQSAFDVEFSKRLIEEVRQAEAEVRGAPGLGGLRVDYTGSYIYALEDAATIRWDIGRYTILALASVLTIFYLGYRNLRILPFVTFPLIVTTLLDFATSLLLFEQLNAVSICFAAILYGLLIDSGIHFYTRLLQERQQRDLGNAVAATLAGLGRANVTASITSGAVFFVIGFSCLGAVRQLGFLTAIGFLLNIVAFFTLYPALGFLLSRRHLAAMAALDTPRIGALAEAAAKRAPAVGITAAVIAAGLLVPALRVGVDSKLTNLRIRDSEAARVQEEIAARFGTQAMSAAVLVRRSELEAALIDGEHIARRLAEYEAEGLLQAKESIETVLPSARVQKARLAAYNQLPRAEAVEMLRASLELHGFAHEPFADFFADFQREREEIVHIDNPALRPMAFLIDHHVRARHGEYIVATYIEPAAGVNLGTIATRLHDDLGEMRLTVTGRSLLEDSLGMILRRELVLFLAGALVGNFILLRVSLGSLGMALAILAVPVLAVVALFATMWALGLAIDPVNLAAVPLILGLGVDYAVYIIAATGGRRGFGEAFRHGGRALVITSLTTVAGFGFLGLSRYPALATMGRLSGAGLFLCMILTVVLLPALLTIVSRPQGEQISSARREA